MVYGLSALIVWEIVWHCILYRPLFRRFQAHPSSFLSALLEMGATGIFGVVLFLLVIVILVIQAVYVVFSNPNAAPACIAFLIIIGVPLFFTIRRLIK